MLRASGCPGITIARCDLNPIPLFGAIGSVLLLGEQLQPFHLIAAALIIAGIVMAEVAARG